MRFAQSASTVPKSAVQTHKVELGGETRFVNSETFQPVCDELVAHHGGQPVITELTPNTFARIENDDRSVSVTPVSVVVGRSEPIREGAMDTTGRDRSNAARFEMRANGFMPKPPIYAVGSRVNELGVKNAESSRKTYDSLPLVKDSCAHLVQQVVAEERKDLTVERLSEVRMRPNGQIHRTPDAGGLPVSEQAFGGLLSRTGIGGHSYLTKCPTDLRATNVNFWMEQLKLQERTEELDALARREKWEPRDAKFRTRLNRDTREIFAVVTPSYGAFDIDKIATAIGMASPPGARGSIVYDGTRAKFENLYHSNIAPAEYVAGEFFKAGVLIRTDDTGGGAIRISAVVWQNLCLNLIILDECVQEIAAIRHVGSVEALARKFTKGFEQALGTIEGFLVKWNYALTDEVIASVFDADRSLEGLKISDTIPGIFNGIVERELVPVRGQRKDVVRGLVRMFEKDTSAATVGKNGMTRAAVVNAFTRYAHEVNTDPFEQDAIERAAGRLLNVQRENKVLPFEKIDF